MIVKFRKTSCKRPVAVFSVLAVLACVTLTDVYPDEPPFTFSTPSNLGPLVNSSYNDGCPNISADGLTLYFTSARPNGFGGDDLWVTTRKTTDDEWSEPVNLGPLVNSGYNEWWSSISADDLSLFLHSNRYGGSGDWDLWLTTRTTIYDPWGTPVNLGPTVNSYSSDGGPSISADGLTLFFHSLRLGGEGGLDLWVTTRATTDANWDDPVNLGPTVNSSVEDSRPSISANGLSLFFHSDRFGGEGSGDLYVTTRASIYDAWGTPVNLGPTVNSYFNDGGPCISGDGPSLFFHSMRPGGSGLWDIWKVDITDVTVTQALPDFNRDGNVDFEDFSFLAFSWSDYWPVTDIFPPLLGDCIIDFKDVDFFTENWLLSMMQASNPNPADGARGIGLDADLNWTPGDETALHEVYFSSAPCALPLVATQPVGQDSYDPPGDLVPSTTYYWWIDEVNDAGPPPGKWPGVMWSFTTIPGEAHTPSPADDAVIPGFGHEYPPGSGNWYIYTKLIFDEGPTAVKHTGYFSEDYNDVANRVQDANLGPPPYGSTPGFETTYYVGYPIVSPANDTLVRGMTYYWCVDETDADGHTYQGDIWEFTIQGFYAFAPYPPNDAVLVDPNVVLSWGEGYGVEDHDVYLGTSWDDVNNADVDDITGIYRGFGKDPNYPCSNLELSTKFYWRIDEVQGRMPPLFPSTIYKGDVWNFTTKSSPPP